MIKLKYIILLFFCFNLATFAVAGDKKDDKMAKKANVHFKKGEFNIAEKFYAQLVKSHPKNVEYNMMYGACLVSTSEDKQEATKYLKFAVKNAGEVGEAHYYYGKLLQQSYQFKEALTNYNNFRSAITTAKADKMEVDALIKQCKTSIKLIEEFRPVKVINAKVMNRLRFEKAYHLGDMNRKVLIKPNDFKTKEDYIVKEAAPQLIVHGQDQNTLFFSGYKYGGRFAILERDIFMVEKSEDGIWSNFLDVGPFINTDFDEDYPYLHPNGRELYFSSKGHGGLGGYDIFKSQLDTITGLWGKPINLGFAINSAFDDILYVVDGNDNIAYFSSNRANNSSEITVYKIIASKKVDNFVLCKGKVTVEGGKDNKVDITVLDAEGKELSKHVSSSQYGDFVFPLPELESYKLLFTYDNTIVKSVKLMTPMKSTQNVIYSNIHFKVIGVPSITSTVDKEYVLTDDEKVVNYEALAKMEVDQKIDIAFGGELPPLTNSIEDIAVTDPEILLKQALLEIDELKTERKDLNDRINAGYLLSHTNTKNAVKLKKELKTLATAIDAGSSEGQQKIADKQMEYNQAVKKIVDVLLFVENQENTFFQNEKEEKIATAYVDQINLARSGQEVDLVAYRKKMIETKQALATAHQNQIIKVNKEIKEIKGKRSQTKSDQFKLKSDIALIKDAIEFMTSEMNKTKKDEIRTEYAGKITSLENEKKKKSPILRGKQQELTTLDSLLSLKEKELKLYSSVDEYSAQPAMKRANLNERRAITKNVKITVNKSKYAGKLDQFIVQNVIHGSEQTTSVGSTELMDEVYSASDEHMNTFLSSNLNDATDEQIQLFSKNIFDIKNVSNGNFEDPQINKNDQLAANNFREALTMRQEIEKKKKQHAKATDPEVKKALKEEIEILEAHLFKMEFEAMVALTKSNDLRQKEKKGAVELAFLLNPGIKIGEIATLYDEVEMEWDEVTMLKQRLANTNVQEQKSNISKEILAKQTSVINKLMRIERISNRQPADIQQTIVKADDLTNNKSATESPINFGGQTTNIPVNNYGRNGPKKRTESAFSGVDISQYGTNSTMRVKKGILLTSDIKYNINTKVPIDIPLGTGVIYKVQIGAFRNKINPEMFNGITPLSGEDTGNGIYRYTAGIFKSLTGANMAKGKIVQLGYSDAFVVAFFNGRRISLTEAENTITNSTESQQQVYKQQKANELAALKKAGIKESDVNISRSSKPNPINSFKSLNIQNSGNNTSSQSTTAPNNNTSSSNGNATRSTNASGIYYTVQIGVYSTKKTSSDLFGISPLVTHTNERGLIRYSTGVFKTMEEANQRKAEARTQGAEDAYVAVYRDGVRISMEEAQGN